MGIAGQLAALIDSERAAAGVPALSWNGALATAAQDYATLHFLDRDPFALDHYLDGGPMDRAQRAGYMGAVGETLVTASPNAQKLMQAWMDSPPHRDILLAAKYQDVGVGCHTGTYVDDAGSTFDVALCVSLVGYR